MKTIGFLACCLALLATTVKTVYAQSTAAAYPAKPVRLIISFVPGGPNDIVGRLLARSLEQGLRQPVIVENRGGAAGTLGTGLAAKAPPDGYTLLIGSLGTFGISPSIYKNLSYDTLKDFEHVAMIAIISNLLVVHPSVPSRSVKELVSLAKRYPDKLNYGAVGGTSHLMAEMMNSMASIKTVHVPYKGASPALVALISGEVDLFFNPFPGLWPHVQSGKIRALAVTSVQRSPFAPELPTMGESGIPGYDASTWFSLAAPAGTSREIVTRLNEAVLSSLKSTMVEGLAGMYAQPIFKTPEQTMEYMRSEIPKWNRAVKAAGVKPQ